MFKVLRRRIIVFFPSIESSVAEEAGCIVGICRIRVIVKPGFRQLSTSQQPHQLVRRSEGQYLSGGRPIIWPTYWLSMLCARRPSLRIYNSIETGEAGREGLHVFSCSVVQTISLEADLHGIWAEHESRSQDAGRCNGTWTGRTALVYVDCC